MAHEAASGLPPVPEIPPSTSDSTLEQQPVVERPHEEHEAFVIVDNSGPSGENGVPKGDSKDKKTKRPAGDSTKPPGSAADDTQAKSMSSKATTKANGTPLVKKIINSGTFGTGTVKPAPITKAKSTGASVAKVVASATSSLRKSTSSSAATQTKTTTSTKPSETTSTADTRRASIVPTSKSPTTPAAKHVLSSSTSTKPTATGPRPSVVSPSGSSTATKTSATAKPRTSLSEGIKKTPATPRSSLSAGTKLPPVAKSSRGAGSISSIREVREDGKALEDLQNKLKEATSLLDSKTERVAALESQIVSLNASLKAALDDVEFKRLAAEDLEKTSITSESELKQLKDALNKLEVDSTKSGELVKSVQAELDEAKATAIAQGELVQTLQAKIQTLEADLHSAEKQFNTLQSSSEAAASAATEAAAAEREVLSKQRADLAARLEEIETLKVVHADALNEANTKLMALQEKVTLSASMEAELIGLREDKERNANKFSELEIEILELKENQGAAEDERGKSLAQLKSLEEQLANAIFATQKAIEEVKTKDEEYARQSADAKKSHEDALKAASDERAKVVADLEALKTELAAAQAAHEQATTQANFSMEELTRKFKETESIHLQKQNDLSEEVKKITAEVESQESKYNAKVEAVKAEHQQLLQEAFERAKSEAGNEHSQDLQALRTESQASIEQLRTAHQTALDNLKVQHTEALELQAKEQEKKLSSLNLELKATQDDLSKAKAALNNAQVEKESLTAQRDEARAEVAAAAAVPAPPDLSAKVESLTRQLVSSKDDQAALTEQLSLTKASLESMSDNQAKELEQAAVGRAEEVTKLRAAHDEEVATLAKQKSEMLVKLSDLEGELATLKASIDAESATSPKSNGAALPSSPGVTKEELQRMHEAHNLKLHDVQAEHERELNSLRDELETSIAKSEELQQEVARKAMEIQYLEQENEDNQDQITRLKEDVENLAKASETTS